MLFQSHNPFSTPPLYPSLSYQRSIIIELRKEGGTNLIRRKKGQEAKRRGIYTQHWGEMALAENATDLKLEALLGFNGM